MRWPRIRAAFAAIALLAALGGCGADESSSELVRLHIAGALDFGEDAATPGAPTRNDQWIIDRDGSGKRAGDEPGADGEFTVSRSELRDLRRDLDALDFEYLDERYEARGGDTVTTTLSYGDESLRVGDLLAEARSGDDEQVERLLEIREKISGLG